MTTKSYYGMFSDRGNERVADIVRTARTVYTDPEQQYHWALEILQDLAKCPDFKEATDTAVREEVYVALVPQLPPDAVRCPACFNGVMWKRCYICTGSGRTVTSDPYDRHELICDACDGAGEVEAGTCTLCIGDLRVSLALSHLYEADKFVRAHEPNWSGDNATHKGITMYSQADWFRKRKSIALQDSKRAEGRVYNHEHVVYLVAGMTVVFYGLSWGYGGEGPNGLADVLADAGFFETQQDALRWVGRLPQDQGWELQAPAKR